MMNKKTSVRKLALLCVIVLVMPLVLTGCHGSGGLKAFEVPAKFDENRQYEISFWAKNDTNNTQVQVYRDAISAFEALYPNITVNMRLYTDYGRIYNDVITNIATDTTPNVCITYPDHIATYMTGNNVVAPLDELIADEKYGLAGSELKFDGPAADEIVPEFMQECMIDSTYYALPYMRSTEACYVNVDMVEALGFQIPDVLTWDFVWEVSEAAMKKDQDGNFLVNGQKTMIPFIYKSTDNMMISMLKQLEAPYSTDEGDILVFNDTTRELLKTIAKHGKSQAFSTFKISSYPSNFMNAGQCIFAIDSTAGASWVGTHAPLLDIAEDKLVEFETAVMTIPQFDPENPRMISQGPSVCVFNKQNPQEVLASWLFTQFLLTNDVQIGYAQTEGYVPVTKKAQESAEYVDYISRMGEDNDLYYDVKIKAAKLLMENTENTFVTPVFNGSASLRNAAGQLIEEVVKGVRRKKTADDAFIDKLYDDMASLYRLNHGDEQTTVGEKKAELGPLPGMAKGLLAGLGAVWLGIIAYAALELLKKKKVKK